MRIFRLSRLAAALIVLPLTACSGLLPKAQQEVNNRWQSFDDAKHSFDQIVPYRTDLDTVRKLGFDPVKTPNIKILNFSQVVRTVLPTPVPNGVPIPPGILDCMNARERCIGYLIEPSRIDRKRQGSFLLDFLNFKRHTVTTGWKFGALIVTIDGTVVFTQWSGTPNIQETEDQKNPLGPLQGAGESLRQVP